MRQTKTESEISKTDKRLSLIDVIAHDPKTDTVVLIMMEEHAWDGSDIQLHELQERFNTYASFVLDGEFAEAHPVLAAKTVRIEVHSTSMPDARSLDLLALIRDQLHFQDIKLEVVVKETNGQRCGCR